jgi:hypothetical protein
VGVVGLGVVEELEVSEEPGEPEELGAAAGALPLLLSLVEALEVFSDLSALLLLLLFDPPRKSVTYQPLPFKEKLVVVMMRCTSPFFSHKQFLSASSLMR